MSNQRYVLLAFVLFAIATGMVAQSALMDVFAQFSMPDNRIGGLLNTSSAVALLVGALTFIILLRNRKALGFVSEVVGELEQVAWPTKDETVKGSTTVVLTTIFTAALIAFYDLIWKNLADLVL